MNNILLIVTGSIAAYKSIDLIRKLEKLGYEVTIILTKNAEKFITKTTISSLSKAKIYTDDIFQDPMLHINLAREHDLILVAPASSSFIAKIAYGFADSLSLSTILAANIPIYIAPAMNPSMYNNQATQANLSLLKAREYKVIGPDHGIVACGEEGYGKWVSEDEIIKYIKNRSDKLKGKKAVITLGSTRENIDPVRFIGNISSGKQGILIAEELASHGCEVQIIAGYVTTEPPRDAIRAYTADEMLEASLNTLPADIYMSVAAICDFKPKSYSNQKIKKSDKNLVLELEPNVDVVSSIADHENRPSLVIGFALESDNYELHARQKLNNKNLDLIVVNKAEFIEQNENEFAICSPDAYEELGKMSKEDLAEILVSKILQKVGK